MNPDALIAQVNIDRQVDGGRELDVEYVTSSLGADAVPVLLDGLEALPRCDAARLRTALLAEGGEATGGGWRSFNFGRHQADRRLAASAATAAPEC